jgi:hypothetical protein
MNSAYRILSSEETVALALQVLAWILTDERRASRLLALTGLDPEGLRDGLGRPAVLRAILDFLLDHEPDLLNCAAALDRAPSDFAAARAALGR